MNRADIFPSSPFPSPYPLKYTGEDYEMSRELYFRKTKGGGSISKIFGWNSFFLDDCVQNCIIVY